VTGVELGSASGRRPTYVHGKIEFALLAHPMCAHSKSEGLCVIFLLVGNEPSVVRETRWLVGTVVVCIGGGCSSIVSLTKPGRLESTKISAVVLFRSLRY
jgi:hypothetical protein